MAKLADPTVAKPGKPACLASGLEAKTRHDCPYSMHKALAAILASTMECTLGWVRPHHGVRHSNRGQVRFVSERVQVGYARHV